MIKKHLNQATWSKYNFSPLTWILNRILSSFKEDGLENWYLHAVNHSFANSHILNLEIFESSISVIITRRVSCCVILYESKLNTLLIRWLIQKFSRWYQRSFMRLKFSKINQWECEFRYGQFSDIHYSSVMNIKVS